MSYTVIILILVAAIWMFGLEAVAITLAVTIIGTGSICGIMAFWFIIGEGR